MDNTQSRTSTRFLVLLITVLLISWFNHSWANALLRYNAVVFDNPAALNQIKDKQIISGIGISLANLHYDGVINGVSGTAHITDDRYLPYFRYAQRIDKCQVVAIEIYNYQSAGVGWQENSFVNRLSTELQIAYWQLTGKYSYKINEELWVGGGIDALRLTDSSRIASFVPNVGIFQTKFTGQAFGANLGIFYKIDKTTSVELTYLSQMTAHAGGFSTLGTRISHFNVQPFVVRPNTFILQVAKMLNPNLRSGIKIAYAFWYKNKLLELNHSAAGNLVKPIFWQNNWYVQLFSNYTFNKCWSLFGAVSYDERLVNNSTHNLMGYPIGDVYSLIIGPVYTFGKGMFQFKPLLVLADIKTNVSSTAPVVSHGQYHAFVSAIDASLTVNI